MNKQDFEAYADLKKFNYQTSAAWSNEFNHFLSNNVNRLSSIKVLDYGCGDGKYFPFYIEKGLMSENVFGVEVAQKRIERCQAIGWTNAMCIQPGAPLSFESSMFDFVNFTEVIEHIPRKSIHGILSELKRVLKPGGVITVTTPNYPAKRFYDLRDAFLFGKWSRIKDDPTHVTFYNHSSLQKLLGLFFGKVEIKPYKDGFLYRKFKYKLFTHKIMAICSIE